MSERRYFVFLGCKVDGDWLETDEIVGWTTHKRARADDIIFFYITAPVSAIIAHGVKLERQWIHDQCDDPTVSEKLMTEVVVTCADHHIPMRVLRELYPDWPWLRYPRQNTQIPEHIVRPFIEMINADEIDIKIEIPEVAR